MSFVKNLSKNSKALMFAGIALILLILGIVSFVFTQNNDSQSFVVDSDVSDYSSETSETSDESSQEQDSLPIEKEYTITVTTNANIPLEGVTVLVYSDSSLKDLVVAEGTNSDGLIYFVLPQSDTYTVVLADIPEGYEADEFYVINGAAYTIALSPKFAGEEDVNKVYSLGDVMFNFSVTDTAGTEYTLETLLATKEAVVLNFWYTTCQPCLKEFPFIEEAYAEYSDRVALLALNPIDTEDAIKAFLKDNALSFSVAAVDNKWEEAFALRGYPTTVIIDRYGTICLIHTGTVPDTEAFKDIFSTFCGDDYVQTIVKDIDSIVTTEPETGTENNPLEYGGVTDIVTTVPGGEVVYCDIYKVTNMLFTISDPDVYVIYNGDTYYPVNGVLTLLVSAPDTFSPLSLGIGNISSDTKEFKGTFSHPRGTTDNPYKLSMGEFSTSVSAGNAQGVYYTFTATDNGTLTIKSLGTSPSVDFDYTLYNLDSYVYNTLGETEDQTSVSVFVKKGETVQLIINTKPDSSFNYPAAKFTSFASFEPFEGDIEDTPEVKTTEFTFTVTDKAGNPMAGVYFRVKNGETNLTLLTDENGKASVVLPTAEYVAQLTLPSGYSTESTEFILNASNTEIAVVLDIITVEKADYVIAVKDPEAIPIQGALISIGGNFGFSDQNGLYVCNLTVGEYTVYITPPEGYNSESTYYTFLPNAKEMVIVLTPIEIDDSTTETPDESEGESSDVSGGDISEPPPQKNEGTYSVTVKDTNGAPITNAVVMLSQNDTVILMKPVDANGTVSATLPLSDYTITLSFSNTTLFFDNDTAVLTEDILSVILTVAPKVSDEVRFLYVGDAHYLSIGGNYAEIARDEINYFVFVPTTEGTYSFSTTDPNAILSYWGANDNFIYNQTDNTDYSNNTFTLNIKEEYLGNMYIIGVTGSDDCLILVKREGNAIYDALDGEWIKIEPTVSSPEDNFVLQLQSDEKVTINYFEMNGNTDDYKLVYNDNDGFYHLGTRDGDILYINLGADAPYISFKTLLDTSPLRTYFFDEDGNFIKKEDYTDCMLAFVGCMDPNTGLYPLNDTIIYIIQSRGEYAGWWDSSSPSYIFTSVNDLNTEIAWMFALCTITIN